MPEFKNPQFNAIGPHASGSERAERTMVFLGDSLTEDGHWSEWFPDSNVHNMGRGGDTTNGVLARLGEVVAAAPDEILLLIGTNDLATRQTVEHLVRNTQSIMVDLRRDLPGARMLLQSILPRARELAEQIQTANIHLRQFAATVRAQYLDLWPAMAMEDGELNPVFSDDRLHLNAAGYDAWLGELRPALERLRDEPPMSRPIQAIHLDEDSNPTYY
ncbi:MAG: GDSL-type esterase/lipase family protein [Terrimesophilobacter sp.]